MKRKSQVNDKRNVRQKRLPLLLEHSYGEISSTEGSLMGEAPLEFYCLNSNMASFIPSTGDNTRAYEVLEGATSNFDFPFNNNMSRIRDYFSSCQLRIIPNGGLHTSDCDLINNDTPTIRQVVKILNNDAVNPFMIKSRKYFDKVIVPGGNILLYTCSQVYNCRIYIFSSRAKPKVIALSLFDAV